MYIPIPRLALSSLFIFAALPANAGMYTLTQFTYPTDTATVSTQSVNRSGQVAVNLFGDEANAYLWTVDGASRTLKQVSGFQTEVLAVNNFDVSVGIATDTKDFRTSRAVVWYGSAPTILPGLGGIIETANAVNDSGQIAGYSFSRDPVAGNITRALWWDEQGAHDLGTGGGKSAAAFGMNNRGSIVGSTRFAGGYETGTIWHNGTVSHVGTLGGSRSVLGDINENGWAIGDSLLAGDNENWRAVLWDGGVLRNLGTLGGDWSSAYDIGDDGTVYGSAQTESGRQHAALWSEGQAFDLNELIVDQTSLSHLVLTTAIGGDNKGNIYGYLEDRRTHQTGTFMLIPQSTAHVPEPAPFFLILLSLGLAGFATKLNLVRATRRARQP